MTDMPEEVQTGEEQGQQVKLFNPIDQTPKLFVPNPTPATPNLNSEDQTNMTSTLASWAQKMNAGADESMSDLMALNQSRIKLGQEEALRSQIASQYQAQKIDALHQLQSEALRTNPSDYSIHDAFSAEFDTLQGKPNHYALEENGTAAMAAQPTGDPSQQALTAFLQAGRQEQTSFTAKAAILSGRLDKLKTQADNEGWVHKGAELAFGLSGLQDLLVNTHLIKGQGSVFTGAAKNFNDQIHFLWKQDPQRFGETLDATIERGVSMWGAGPTYEAVKHLGGYDIGTVGQSALSYNLWTYAGPAAYLPIMKMAKFASGLARVAGNRALSTNLAAAGIAAKSLGIPSGMEHVQPIEASIAETIPSVSVPDTLSLARGDVGVVSDVADRLEALRKGTEAVKAQMVRTPRLQPAQAYEALQRAVQEAENTYRDTPIADIKRADPVPVSEAGTTEPFPVTPSEAPAGPSKAKEFVGVSNKLPLTPTQELEQQVRNLHRDMEEMRALNGGKLDESSVAQYKNDLAELSDKYGILSGLSDKGELRPMIGKIKRTGQSKAAFEIDTDTDVDNLSHWNARGEIYPTDTPVGPTFRTNPFKLLLDHDLEVARLDREGAEAALQPKAPETGEVGGIRSVPTVSQSPTTGLYSLNFYVGKDQAAGGFLTRDGAVAAAERRGIGNPEVHQTLDGNWYIKINHIVPETGISTKAVEASDFPAVYKPSEFIKSLDGLMPTLFNEARKGPVVGQTRYIAKVIGPYAKNIKRLNGEQTRVLSSVLKSGEAEHQWYGMDELYDKYQAIAGRIPTQKEALAYYSAKELSDLAYHIRNDRLYTLKARRGMQTIQITNPEIGLDTGRVNGRVVPAEEAKGQFIFVADDGSVSQGVRKDVQFLLDTGHYKMVQLESKVMQDNKPVKYILAHDDSMKAEPLERRQLEYNAGGSREYANKWFVKQANYVDDAEGHRTWLDPHTHVTGPTRKSLKAYTDGMEHARQIYISDRTEAEKRLLMDRTPIESYDKFDQMVKAGTIHPHTPFETVFDKEDPAFMKRIGENDTNLTDPNLRGEEGYYQTQARMYYGEKGERLRDPSGNLAPVLNPLKVLRRSVYNAVETKMLGDYNTKVIEDWHRAASPFIDYNSVSDNPDAFETFFNAQLLDKGLSPEEQRMVSSLDIARNAHKRFMNFRDLDQTTKALWWKKQALMLEGKGKLGEAAATAIYNRLSSNPISATRDLVFQGYFGFLNLKRFVLHASQAIGAMSVDPVRGLTAGGMAPLTSALVHINRSDALLDYIARKMGPDLGMPIKDYKEMVQSLRYSGWLNVGGEVAQLDRYADRWGGNILTKGWDTVKQFGPAPFNAAIYLQRLTGYHMAWSMAKELMPEEATTSARFQGWVNNKTDVLTGNMTRASSAAWQKGVWSVPTQFSAFIARMFENLLPETFGGSRALSSRQKLQYVIGQAALWGAGGGLGLGTAYDFIADQYRQNTGQQIDSETHRAITKGLMDSMIYHFTGADTDMSSIAGLGASFDRSMHGFINGDANPFLSVMGGPVYETGNQVVDRVGKVINYMKAEQADSLSTDQFAMAIKDAIPLVQGFKYDLQGYWVWKYHWVFDPNTGQPVVAGTNADAITQALGIPNVWQTAKSHYYQTEQDREDTVNDVAKAIVKVRREEFDAINTGDQERQAHYRDVVRVLMQPWRDQPLMSQQIAQRATQLMSGGYAGTEKEQIIKREQKQTGFVPSEATEPK